MSTKIQSVRGTQDFLPEQSRLYRGIEKTARHIAQLYGFEEIMTPIFEFSEVFHRSLGESSDAISKETYNFVDRGGDQLTLRPEGTASVVRAFVANGMAQNLPLKLYYSGPMFRYERPQKGRYRQFHQIGIEALGFEHYLIDVECIALAQQLLQSLGLAEKAQIEINTLGDRESRMKYRQALLDYLTPFRQELSPDSQIRLEKNPLRILDSKDLNDQKLVAQAPPIEKFLNVHSLQFFENVLKALQDLNLQAKLNPHLVRGLDYYTHTVFEITSTHLGSQSALIAGGRYDGLVEQLGGPVGTSGFGWGAGIERLMLLCDLAQFQTHEQRLAIIPADEQSLAYCLILSQQLRKANHSVELITGGNLGKKMKRANKIGATTAIIIGETELNSKQATVKNLKSGEQSSVAFAKLADYFKPLAQG